MSAHEEAARKAQASHPSLRARFVRGLRGLRNVRGWQRAASWFGGRSTRPFLIQNGRRWFEGNFNSFIDRQVYLFGGYEEEMIDLFLAAIPPDRRRAILDVGANIGTHSLRFAEAFRQVHAFEPNPHVMPALARNVALTGSANITLHPVGLADKSGEFDFYSADRGNAGLGTFSAIEQYDAPLQKVGTAQLEVGDAYLPRHLTEPVDAIKIDVQGFEPNVLTGMRRLLTANRPIVWIEIGNDTLRDAPTLANLAALFPYPIRVSHFVGKSSLLFHSVALNPVDESALPPGNYVIFPDDGAASSAAP